MTPSSAAALLAVIALALYSLYRFLLPKPLPGIAYNTDATKNLFGDAPSMAEEVGRTGELSFWFANQVEKMGSPLCQVFVLPFQKPWILLADFREAQDILFRRAHEFDKPRFFTDGLACLGDFHIRQPTNSIFKARRQMKQDLMTPTFLNTYMGPFIHSHGLELIRLLQSKMNLAGGRPFSAFHDFDFLALDVMLRYAFGDNNSESALDPQLALISGMGKNDIARGHPDEAVIFPEASLGPFLRALQEAPEVLEKTTVSWTPKLSHWWWSQQRWYKKIFSQKQITVTHQVGVATKNEQSGQVKSALEHMLHREQITARKQDRDPNYGGQSLIDEIFADIIAGHHTTGSTMCWLTKFLTGYPFAQNKLRQSLYSAIPDALAQQRSPTFEEIRTAKVPYLEAVIEEQLRLTPFSMAREATRDTVVLGRVIPKGCQVMMVNAGPGFLSPALPVSDKDRSETSMSAKAPGKWDESVDLRLFDPERWLVYKQDGTVEFDAAAGPQLGFGGGIRQCWGRRMAHLEVRTIIALVVWHFHLLEIPDALAGFAGIDGISRQPQRTFVRLAKTDAVP